MPTDAKRRWSTACEVVGMVAIDAAAAVGGWIAGGTPGALFAGLLVGGVCLFAVGFFGAAQ